MVRRHSPRHVEGTRRGPRFCWVPSVGLPGYHVVTSWFFAPHSVSMNGNEGPVRITTRWTVVPVLSSSAMLTVEE